MRDEGHERVLEILAAHHAPDVDPSGWWAVGDGYTLLLQRYTTPADADKYSARILLGDDAGREHCARGTAVLADGVLTLNADNDEFDDRLHLCRFGSEEVLLSEGKVSFTRYDEPVPLGKVFRRADDLPRFIEASLEYLPGPGNESEPATWPISR